MKAKKAQSTPSGRIITFIFMAIPILTVMLVLFFFITVRIDVSHQRDPLEARGQILVHKLLNCAGGSPLQVELLDDSFMHSCYAVDSNNRELYPVYMDVVWTEDFRSYNRSVKSANVFGANTKDISYPVLVSVNDTIYSGMATFKIEVLT